MANTRQRHWTLGTLVVVDLDVHQRKWLVHSARNTPEGNALEETCKDRALKQIVREPIREKYLLDLVLTDLAEVRVLTHPRVADHNLLEVEVPLPVACTTRLGRKVWS